MNGCDKAQAPSLCFMDQCQLTTNCLSTYTAQVGKTSMHNTSIMAMHGGGFLSCTEEQRWVALYAMDQLCAHGVTLKVTLTLAPASLPAWKDLEPTVPYGHTHTHTHSHRLTWTGWGQVLQIYRCETCSPDNNNTFPMSKSHPKALSSWKGGGGGHYTARKPVRGWSVSSCNKQ